MEQYFNHLKYGYSNVIQVSMDHFLMSMISLITRISKCRVWYNQMSGWTSLFFLTLKPISFLTFYIISFQTKHTYSRVHRMALIKDTCLSWYALFYKLYMYLYSQVWVWHNPPPGYLYYLRPSVVESCRRCRECRCSSLPLSASWCAQRCHRRRPSEGRFSVKQYKNEISIICKYW